MKQKSKLILSVTFIATFLVVFLLATFYDLEISRAICRLTGETYLSNNLFGRFFETFGESPLYIICGFATANFARGCLKIKKNWLKITLTVFCVALGVLAYYIVFQRMTEYACEHFGKIEFYEKLGTYLTCGWLVLAGGAIALTLYLTFKIPEKYLKGLIAFSFSVLIALILAQGWVQGVKSIVGRQRYRAIKVLEYHELDSLIDYSKWFVINGKRVVTEEMLALGIAKDGYKSFPSGHTCAAAMSFTLIFLPDFLGLEEGKRVKLKGIMIGVSFLFTALVALSRIVVGAHYLTDVLFGAGWTYLSAWVSKIIMKKISKV
ncbi:MAG: phosphatase PAP2 family protein [Clostridiales bacterium]|nr:phosphatase PAP2 family protein [Clostridiales bacterium]